MISPRRDWLRLGCAARDLYLSRFVYNTARPPRPPPHLRYRLPNLTLKAKTRNPWVVYPTLVLVLGGSSLVAYEKFQPFRYLVLSAVRCSRVASAAIAGAIDYKITFARTYTSEDERLVAYSDCHTRSAHRVLKALLANGG